MRRKHGVTRRLTTVVAGGLLAVWPMLSLAAPAIGAADPTTGVPSLVISQFKITSSNGQFITLYNPTDSLQSMSNYQLEYFNNFDLGKATSSKLIALSGTVPPHSYFMVSDDSLRLCYQMTMQSASLGLSSTAGLVEVLHFSQSDPGSGITTSVEESVGWSKTAAAGAQTLPANTAASLLRQPQAASGVPLVTAPAGGSWQPVQPSPSDACQLVKVNDPANTPVNTGLNELLPSVEPPALIVSLAASGQDPAAPSLPAADIGLMAPRLSEILPNPLGSGNDASDEFVELYNPNATSFDLTGFSLQSGIASLHHAAFPSGTLLPAKSFTAFYSSNTGLSQSNSGGQVQLLDPFGSSLSSTAIYGSAKDGQAWALANGKWYWTDMPTPNAANVIKQSGGAAKNAARTSSTKSRTTTGGAQPLAAANASVTKSDASQTPIHLTALALVGGLALLYGAYEYRADLANHFYWIGRHLRLGSSTWPAFTRRRSH